MSNADEIRSRGRLDLAHDAESLVRHRVSVGTKRLSPNAGVAGRGGCGAGDRNGRWIFGRRRLAYGAAMGEAVGQILPEAARRFGDKTALVCGFLASTSPPIGVTSEVWYFAVPTNRGGGADGSSRHDHLRKHAHVGL